MERRGWQVKQAVSVKRTGGLKCYCPKIELSLEGIHHLHSEVPYKLTSEPGNAYEFYQLSELSDPVLDV